MVGDTSTNPVDAKIESGNGSVARKPGAMQETATGWLKCCSGRDVADRSRHLLQPANEPLQHRSSLCTKLLHKTQTVQRRPTLNDLAVTNSPEHHTSNNSTAIGGLGAQRRKRTLMRSSPTGAHRDEIPFGHNVLDLDAQIGKCCAEGLAPT